MFFVMSNLVKHFTCWWIAWWTFFFVYITECLINPRRKSFRCFII